MRQISLLLAPALLVSGIWAARAQSLEQLAAEHPLTGRTIGLDHALLWASDRAAADAFLSKRLGFRLGPTGSYAEGIRHNIIRFANRSFIEFLWLSDAAAARKGAPWAYDFVSKHNGSNAFGIQVGSVDAAYKILTAVGLRPDEPMSEALDPDGPEGPQPSMVNEWRFMFLGEGAAPGDPFFVEYTPKKPPAAAPRHPNGAVQLQSVWIAVADLGKAKETYSKAGLRPTRAISNRWLNASGVAFQTGDGEIILLMPNGPGRLRKRLVLRGEHIVGMDIRVGDLKATREFLGRHIDGSRLRAASARSVTADATRELGVYFNFQE
jgi:hypothetical protein